MKRGMFGMITLREEKLRMALNIFVEKRDIASVQFDVEKIYKALLKATEEVTSHSRDGSQTKLLSIVWSQGSWNVFQMAWRSWDPNVVEHES